MNLMALAGALADSDKERARDALRESVQLHDSLGFAGPQEVTQATLSAARIGDWDAVVELAPRSVRQLHWNGDRPQLAGILNVVARALVSTDVLAAAVLQGAARHLAVGALATRSPSAAGTEDRPGPARAPGGFSFLSELRRTTTTALRQAIDEEQLKRLRAEGEAMDEDRAIGYALDALTRAVTVDAKR
jgi:hypothetical protein